MVWVLNIISEMFAEHKPDRCLRSAGAGQLAVPSSETKQGEVAFSHSAARYWSQLPVEIRSASTVASFKKKKLKTVLFSIAFN